ncbi:MAG TPA: PP2C family protein-serine/threonine phosphatase [Bryobacterales bacterium]|nr:PP2C family protein-serine/threonine phosphatase [Bryobacterales bacterium]
MELYAGNERAHRHVKLPGLEGDVIALPSEGRRGGDLYALFSCGDQRYARMVLADAVGHGFSASAIASHLHKLLHQYRDVQNTADLLGMLNETFLEVQPAGEPLRLTTAAVGNYDRQTGQFHYSYAAHPRMLLWRGHGREWRTLGTEREGGLPLGVTADGMYREYSIGLEPGDVVMAFSDALTEVKAPDRTEFTAEGFLRLANTIACGLARPLSLHDFSEGLLGGVRRYHDSEKFEDDLTLLTLRRVQV